MFSGGDSPQKNIEGLIKAYAALPDAVRKEQQLAIICPVRGEGKNHLRRLAVDLGLAEQDIVFTGHVSDEMLIAAYNFCSVFVFPSWHEGFGLPVLEAMSCGAPVLASRAASLPEVVGWDGALFDPHGTEELTSLLLKVLDDPGFREKLLENGANQACQFSWEKSADRSWEAFEKALEKSRGLEDRKAAVHTDRETFSPKVTEGRSRRG
jgi:glycosyltransferase involved in cell wall biosynthesis